MKKKDKLLSRSNRRPDALEQLRELNRSPGELEQLQGLLTKFNAFSVLRAGDHELRHSNVVAWLLDPKGDHGLGTLFLCHVLRAIEAQNPGREECCGLSSLSDVHLANCQVDREYRNRDIQLKIADAKTVLVIENKWDAEESADKDGKAGQLSRYKKDVEAEFRDYSRKVFVFLTPDRRSPTKKEWSVLGYEDIYEALTCTSINEALEREEFKAQKMFIEQYLTTVGRKVNRMEKELELCDDLYSRYGAALDFIAEYRFHVRDEVMRRLQNSVEKDGMKLIPSFGKKANYIQFNRRFPKNSNASVHYETLSHDDGGIEVCFHVENETAVKDIELFKKELAKHDLTKRYEKNECIAKVSLGKVATIGRLVDDVYNEVVGKLRELYDMFEATLLEWDQESEV